MARGSERQLQMVAVVASTVLSRATSRPVCPSKCLCRPVECGSCSSSDERTAGEADRPGVIGTGQGQVKVRVQIKMQVRSWGPIPGRSTIPGRSPIPGRSQIPGRSRGQTQTLTRCMTLFLQQQSNSLVVG